MANGCGIILRDMREIFQVGDKVRASRVKTSREGKESGEVFAVTKYLVIIQFAHSRESYTYFDYATGIVS